MNLSVLRPIQRSLLFGVAVFAVGYLTGALSLRFELFPYYQVKALLDRWPLALLATRAGYGNTTGRTEISCVSSASAGAMVLLIFGQSNAANSGSARFSGSPQVVNFNPLDGRCYVAQDPLLGTSGDGGSAWIVLSMNLIERRVAERVIVAPLAVSGTRVADWAPGGPMFARLENAVRLMRAQRLQPSALLWHQSQAQYELSTSYEGLRQGPDTDQLLDPSLRAGCHFNRQGQVRHAALWFDSLVKAIPSLAPGP